MKGRTMKLDCMVWYGMVFFAFFFFFFSFLCIKLMGLVGDVAMRERGRESGGERERSASKQRAAMYTFIISHLSFPRHIHSLNHR